MIEIVQDVLDYVMDKDDSFEIRAGYFGRGMENPCLGIVASSIESAFMFMYHVSVEFARFGNDDEDKLDEYSIQEAIADLFNPGSTRVDSMGHQTVYYWPHIRIVKEQD